MAGSRTTFNKRAKERARQERRLEKAQKKSLRQQEEKQTRDPELSTGQPVIALDEDGQPLPLDFHDF